MLKRIVICLTGLAVMAAAASLAGCTDQPSQSGPDAKPPTAEVLTDSALDLPEEESIKFPMGLYINTGNGSRELQTQIQTEFIPCSDLVVLSAFATAEPSIPGSKFGPVWSSYRDGFPDLSSYKIGYCLSYGLNAGDTVTQMLLAPKDAEANREYVEVYLYDDVHQTGWYSHLLSQDMTQETVITSVKLTGGAKVGEVSGITLSAFWYKSGEEQERAGEYKVDLIKN
jgi:hypothetical protein